MRRVSLMSLVLLVALGGLSCHTRGIIELSADDAQRCYEILAEEDALFAGAVSALDEFISNAPDKEAKLTKVHAECKDYLDKSDKFVKSLYEKYRVREGEYRLDVFRGTFMPITARDRASASQ